MRLILGAALVLAACSDPPPPPQDLARPAPAVAPAPPVAATAPPVAATAPPVAATAPPVAAARPPAEVELFGHLTLPKNSTGELHVYITDGECWKPATRAFADVRASERDGFSVEVIVKQGQPLWVCAALIPPKGPITIHGELASAPLKGEGLGEVRFPNLSIALAPGKPVVRPAPAK